MMRFLVFFILTILSFVNNYCFAQNYQLVKSGSLNLFKDPSNSIYGVRIDSFHLINNDSILYPYKNIYELEPNCFSPEGPSILGYHVVANEDGINYLINVDLDSIKINVSANVGECWTAYQNENNLSIVACIKDEYLKSFPDFGLSNFVKEISFEAQDSLGANLNHAVNNNCILLSKDYGLIKTFEFRKFPNEINNLELIGMSNPKVGKQNLTKFEVYNYSIGDEIHTLILDNPASSWENYYQNIESKNTYRRQSILNRTNYFPDSIIYQIKIEDQIEIKYYTAGLNEPDSIIYKYETEVVNSKIIPDYDFDLPPNYPASHPSSFLDYNICENYKLILNDDNRLVKIENLLNDCVYNVPISYSSTGFLCWNKTDNSSNVLFQNYGVFIEGIGDELHKTDPTDYLNPYNVHFIQYWKKGNEMQGTPFLFTSNQTLILSKQLSTLIHFILLYK